MPDRRRLANSTLCCGRNRVAEAVAGGVGFGDCVVHIADLAIVMVGERLVVTAFESSGKSTSTLVARNGRRPNHAAE